MPANQDVDSDRTQADLSTKDSTDAPHPPLGRSRQAVGREAAIARLLKGAGDTGEQDTYAGKRETIRFYSGMQLEVIADASQAPIIQNVSVHNASEGGVAFWSRFNLPVGTSILLRPFSSDQPCKWIKARVRHYTSGIRGVLIGAEFEQDSAPTCEPPTEPA